MKRVRLKDVADVGNLKTFLQKKSARFDKSKKITAFDNVYKYALDANRVEKRGKISFPDIWQPSVEAEQHLSLRPNNY